MEVATVLEVIDLKVDWHFWWRRIILKLSQPTLYDGASLILIVKYLIEVGDTARSVRWRVIWQADVEETGVLERNELVHIILRRADKKQIVSSK